MLILLDHHDVVAENDGVWLHIHEYFVVVVTSRSILHGNAVLGFLVDAHVNNDANVFFGAVPDESIQQVRGFRILNLTNVFGDPQVFIEVNEVLVQFLSRHDLFRLLFWHFFRVFVIFQNFLSFLKIYFVYSTKSSLEPIHKVNIVLRIDVTRRHGDSFVHKGRFDVFNLIQR